MHKLDSVLENETHEILWNFKIQMDHFILARKPDLVLFNKKKKKQKTKQETNKKNLAV